MGQKVNPNGIRLGITKPFSSTWYAGTKQFPSYLQGDFAVRNYLTAKLKDASVSKIIIDRPAKSIKVTIRTARPGIVVGKSGANIEPLRLEVEKLAGVPAQIKVVEIHHGKEEIEAQLVANSSADQLEHPVMFRRAIKKAVQNALRAGAKGIKVQVSGRLGGAEISRSEWIREGRVPLHTLRADIDYALAEAQTTYGVIGIKVWIFKGEILGKMPLNALEEDDSKSEPKKPRRQREPRSAR